MQVINDLMFAIMNNYLLAALLLFALNEVRKKTTNPELCLVLGVLVGSLTLLMIPPTLAWLFILAIDWGLMIKDFFAPLFY